MVQISRTLQLHGFSTFVPHADGMEFSLVRPVLTRLGFSDEAAGQLLHEAIFALDVYQVVAGCGSLVLNLNGRVPDEGAVAEATMAWMLGKPVVIYKEDRRSLIAGRDNPLVVGQAAFLAYACMEDLAVALAERVASLAEQASLPLAPPPHLDGVVSAGERLWLRMQAEGALPGAEERIAEVLIDLFAADGAPQRAALSARGNGHPVPSSDGRSRSGG